MNELTTENRLNPFSMPQYLWKVKMGYFVLLIPIFSHELPKSKLHYIQSSKLHSCYIKKKTMK